MRKLLICLGLAAYCFNGTCTEMSTDEIDANENPEICTEVVTNEASTGFFGKIKRKAECSFVKAIDENKKFKANAMLTFLPDLAGSKDEQNFTALMSAVNEQNIPLVEKLLEKGVDVNAKSEDGETALLIACQVGNHTLIEKLLERNAEVNVKNEQGESPLILAVCYEDLPLVKELLDKGADIGIRDAQERTPLIWAAENNNIPIIEELLRRGADVYAKDEEGNMARDLAGSEAKALIDKREAEIAER